MEYQKIINLLDNIPNQLSKFRTKNWIEINDQSRGVYNTNSDIRFKSTMAQSSLCGYSDRYILFKGTIAITGEGADAAARQADVRNKGVIFKNCAPFINCKSEINNTEIDNAKDIDILMPMYNLIEYSDNYSKTSGSLWQFYCSICNCYWSTCRNSKCKFQSCIFNLQRNYKKTVKNNKK